MISNLWSISGKKSKLSLKFRTVFGLKSDFGQFEDIKNEIYFLQQPLLLQTPGQLCFQQGQSEPPENFLIGIGLEIVNLYLEIFSLLANLLNPHLSKEQWIGIVDAAKKYNNGLLYTMMIMMIMMNMMIKMNMMIWPVNKKKGVARTNWKSPHHRKLIYETWWMCVTHKLTVLEEILKWIKWHKMSKCHLVIAWGVQKVDL